MKTAIKLPPRRALAALRDVSRNDGMMWEPKTGREAAMLWGELRRRGWVEGSAITPAGRAALEERGDG